MIQLTPPLDNPESGRRMNPHAARSHFPISPHQAVSPVTAWSTNLWRPGLVLFSVSQQLFQNGSHGPIALFSLGPQKIRKRFLEAKNHGRRLRSWLCPAPFGHSHRYRYAYIHMYIRCNKKSLISLRVYIQISVTDCPLASLSMQKASSHCARAGLAVRFA